MEQQQQHAGQAELLTAEQQARVRENRDKALALKRKREAEADAEVAAAAAVAAATTTTTTTSTTNTTSTTVPTSCCECGATEGLEPVRLEAFGVGVCKACVDRLGDYDLLTKSEASAQYLLPDDTLNFLPHRVKPNPHNQTWAPMKQFLRKAVRDKSHERWKDEAGLQAEKARRDKLKYERDVDKAKASAAAAAGAAAEAAAAAAGGGGGGAGFGAAGGGCEETSLILAQMLAGADGLDGGDAGEEQDEGGNKGGGKGGAGGSGKAAKKPRVSGKAGRGLAGMLKCIVGSDD